MKRIKNIDAIKLLDSKFKNPAILKALVFNIIYLIIRLNYSK